jgi:hypothetical protein
MTDYNLIALQTHTTLNLFHDILEGPASVAGSVLDMEVLGKTLGSFVRPFDLSKLSPFFQNIVRDNKLCLEVIGSYKGVFSLVKLTSCDEVGRPYWETHTVIELTALVLNLGSYLIGTVRYVCRLAVVVVSASLPLWKSGFTSVSLFCKGYSEYCEAQNLQSKLTGLKLAQEWSSLSEEAKGEKWKTMAELARKQMKPHKREADREEKVEVKDLSALIQRYQTKRLNTLKNIFNSEQELNKLGSTKPENLKSSRESAFAHLKKIKAEKLKINIYQNYLSVLEVPDGDESAKLARFAQLKKLKWANRVDRCNYQLKTTRDARNFHLSCAAFLALQALSTVFNVQNIYIIYGLNVMGWGSSAIGVVWLVDKLSKKTYEII